MSKNIDMSILKCPQCGANLEVENDLDVCYCKYCGCRIIMHGRSDEAYKAEAKIKGMAHEETMLDKQIAFEKYKMQAAKEEKQAENRSEARYMVGAFVFIGLCVLFIIWTFTTIGRDAAKQTKKLNDIVEQARTEMDAGDYAKAYEDAESIEWWDEDDSEKQKKWNKIRENLIDDIVEAEKADTGAGT